MTGESWRFAPVRSIQMGMNTDQEGPDRGAEDRGRPADHDGDQQGDRQVEAELLAADERVLQREQRAGDPGQHGAHTEHDDLVRSRVHAEGRGRGLVVADRDDRPAGPAADQVANEYEGDDREREEDVVLPLVVR